MIRLGQLKDLNQICEIAHASYPGELERYHDIFRYDINANSDEHASHKIFVYENDGRVLGYGKIFLFDPDKHPTKFKSPAGAYLNGCVVAGEFRRQGIASQLLAAREKYISHHWNKLDVFSIVNCENIASVEYHLKCLFKEKARSDGFLMSDMGNNRAILFQKNLCLL